MRGKRLRNLTLGTHGGLALAVAATLAAVETSLWLRLIVIAVALIPLAATLPGLLTRRRATLAWLALALVLYAGAGSVEVIAAGTLAAAALLLFALLELGLVLMLSRAPATRSPGAAKGS